MKSVNEVIGFLKRSMSGDRQNRRKQPRGGRAMGNVEAVEQRLLLAADLTDALYNSAVMQQVADDQLVDSYFLRFETAQDIAALTQATNAASITASPFVDNGYTLNFDQGMTLQTAADVFTPLTGFDYMHPDVDLNFVTEAVPNDTLYGDQWHLKNTGQGGGVAGIDVNIENVWDNYTGRGVTIGIVDGGVETAHPDFVGNINTTIDYDWLQNDNDPNPVGANDNHGTSVAGVAAAKGNNALGVSGSAWDAELVGMRLIGGPAGDRAFAEAASHRTDIIDIYNNSWGPANRGALGGIGPQTVAAIQDSAENGRGGLGVIRVHSSGNGGLATNSNYNPFNNSRYSITVAALGNDGVRASYSTPGAVVDVTAPSNGGTLGITTTDRTGAVGYSTTDYANDFGGTSSATPLVSGIIALMLEANPALSYRDVADILHHTADQVDPGNADWTQNGAGLWVNHSYGFGVVNAEAAVNAALNHVPLGEELSYSTGVQTVSQAIPDNGAAVTASIDVPVTDSIASLEYVQLVFDAQHQRIGDLEIILTSPSGTESVMAETRTTDLGTIYRSWEFGSVRHWDESSAGTWTVSVRDGAANNTGTFDAFELRFFGTGTSFAPVVIQTGGTTVVSDSGQTDTFRVALPTQPVSNVVLNVISTDVGEVTLSTSQLTFTPTNWDVPQTVTATGVFDLIADGNQMTAVNVSVVGASSDPAFVGAPVTTFQVTSLDDDAFYPGKPVVTNPIGLSATDTPQFRWNSGRNSASFTLTVTDVVSGAVVTETTGLTGNSHTFTDPFAEAVYRVTVTAVNTLGQANVSVPVLFAVGIPEIPIAPVVTSPTIGQTVLTSTPQIRWTPVANAFEYEVFARSGNDVFQETVKGVDAGNGQLGHTFTQAFNEGTATVYVRGLNALGQAGPWSEMVEFTVDAVPRPQRPVITSPSVAVTQNAFPEFRWSAPGGNTYQLWVGRVPDADGSGSAATVNNRVINLTGHTDTSYTHFIALRNAQYVAWVRSFNAVGEPSEWSQSVTFEVNVPIPDAPMIVSYLPNGTQPTLEWATSGADYTPGTTFHLWVNNLSTGEARVVNETTLTDTSYTFAEALPQGRYGAWVRATSAVGGLSAWSPRYDFVIDIATPARPTMTGPVENDGSSTLLTEFPTFTWTAAANAATYDLWVNHLDSNTSRIIREIGIEGTSFVSDDALPEGSYRAWVRGYNSAGEVGEWSSVYTFDINVPGPARPTITGPATNAVGTVNSATPTVSWFALGGAASYNLQLQALPSNASVINQTGITTEQFTVPVTLNEQSYRVRVQSVNSVGEVSEWSDWYTFRVDVPNATTPTAYLPQGTVTQSRVTFEWLHSNDSVRYEILVRDLLNQESIVLQVSSFQVDPTLGRAVYSANLADGTYRFWVRAFNSQGTSSAWSNSKAFVVDAVASLDAEIDTDSLQIALTSLVHTPQPAEAKAATVQMRPTANVAELDARDVVRTTPQTNPEGESVPAKTKSDDISLAAVMAELADPARPVLIDEQQG